MQEFLRQYFTVPFLWIIDTISSIEWEQKYPITDQDKALLEELLTKNYFIIATRRSNLLSSYAISLANFLLRGKFGYYSHVLMNMENTVNSRDDFMFVEALGSGTQFSSFTNVFGNGQDSPDAVALLKPKNMSIDKWTAVLDKAREQVGKPYDTLFDLKDESKLSCVELIRLALQSTPNYDVDFAHFEKMIKKHKNLTPQMFLDCKDFEVVWEVRRAPPLVLRWVMQF